MTGANSGGAGAATDPSSSPATASTPAGGGAPDAPVAVGTIVVGGGFSGLGMAIALRESGDDDFVILEKAGDVGGAWRENTYPGCACDVQSNLYSYSFELNPDWSRTFPRQQEIWDYLRRCVERYSLRAHLRFGAEVTDLEFDDETSEWTVTTRAGGVYRARTVVLGAGPLHLPAYPDVPGRERFAGPAFHSAAWDHGVDLDGKRVAVIGTGASAVQFVPHLAERAARLTLFQRTPPWIMAKPDRPVSDATRRRYARFPLLQRLRRATLYWTLESRAIGFTVNPKLMGLAQRLARRHLAHQVADPELRARLTPDYTLGCKRVLLSNDYYPAVARDDVDVVTRPIREITEHGVVTADGTEHPADVLVFGTGFHVVDAFDGLRVVGEHGLTLREAWRERMQAHLGVAVAGFPNLFMLVGPNTGLGHNSMVFMIESGIRYVMGAIELRDRAGAARIGVRPDVQLAFNQRLRRDLARSVWSVGGCTSWYLDRQGNNSTLWPRFTVEYWWRTRRLSRDLFDLGSGPASSR